MTRTLDATHLVVGAGASGMAFTDALVDHDPTARVALVDRREGPGGHWRAAYPFVRLHQASQFYGVASTVLGGQRQTSGPEEGLFQRAGQPEIVAYYDAVLARLAATGRVETFFGADHVGGVGGEVVAATGERYAVPAATRVVDARYLAPEVPSEVPPRFDVGDGVRVVPVNDLPREAPSATRFVVVGSGKTATDAVVWLLGEGVDPGAVCWVRPREPWMLDRARVQPDPAVFTAMTADLMTAAAVASDLGDLFARLEAAGVMLRLDPHHTPTMAKAPTLGRWERDLLATVDDVVRRGRVTAVRPGRLELDEGSVAVAADALVVDCAADGLRNRPLVPIWGQDALTLQPIRAGFPCFGAALAGYVEATRPGREADEVKNALCPPSPLGNTRADYARMTLTGLGNAARFNAEPDVKAWADTVALNPARVPPDHPGSPELDAARERLAAAVGPARANLERLV